MIGAKITITDVLAIAAGKLAAEHPDSSVEIRYDDDRAEQLWEVIIEQPGIAEHSYVVDDQTGETVRGVHRKYKASYLRDLGRRMDEATRSDR